MPKLIAITLGAVAAVLASVWFRRRPALKKPRAIDPRIDEQPHSAKAQVTHGADAGLSAQRMILERQDQSSEAPQDLTSEPSTPDLRDVSILSTLQTEEVASGATGEMVAGALPVLEYPSEKSEVATPAEPIGIHPSADPVPPPSTNGFLPDRVDEEIREPKEKYARIAAPRIASPQNEEIVGEPGTPVDLPKFSETAIRIASSELAGVAEEMVTTQPKSRCFDASDRSDLN